VRASSADMDGDDLMRQADLALYKSKSEGRGRYSLFETNLLKTTMGMGAGQASATG